MGPKHLISARLFPNFNFAVISLAIFRPTICRHVIGQRSARLFFTFGTSCHLIGQPPPIQLPLSNRLTSDRLRIRYLTSLDRETRAFKSLIEQKARMAVPVKVKVRDNLPIFSSCLYSAD